VEKEQQNAATSNEVIRVVGLSKTYQKNLFCKSKKDVKAVEVSNYFIE
jgi:hypothetical protein